MGRRKQKACRRVATDVDGRKFACKTFVRKKGLSWKRNVRTAGKTLLIWSLNFVRIAVRKLRWTGGSAVRARQRMRGRLISARIAARPEIRLLLSRLNMAISP